MHTGTEIKDVSLAKEFKYNLEGEHRKMVPLIKENEEKDSWKENGQKESIMFRIMHLWN